MFGLTYGRSRPPVIILCDIPPAAVRLLAQQQSRHAPALRLGAWVCRYVRPLVPDHHGWPVDGKRSRSSIEEIKTYLPSELSPKMTMAPSKANSRPSGSRWISRSSPTPFVPATPSYTIVCVQATSRSAQAGIPGRDNVSLSLAAPEFGPRRLYAHLSRLPARRMSASRSSGTLRTKSKKPCSLGRLQGFSGVFCVRSYRNASTAGRGPCCAFQSCPLGKAKYRYTFLVSKSNAHSIKLALVRHNSIGRRHHRPHYKAVITGLP